MEIPWLSQNLCTHSRVYLGEEERVKSPGSFTQKLSWQINFKIESASKKNQFFKIESTRSTYPFSAVLFLGVVSECVKRWIPQRLGGGKEVNERTLTLTGSDSVYLWSAHYLHAGVKCTQCGVGVRHFFPWFLTSSVIFHFREKCLQKGF